MEDQDQKLDDAFGEWVKSKRNQTGLSVAELSQGCGMPRGRWLAIERGSKWKSITKPEAAALALALDVPVVEVVRRVTGDFG